jgi:hypothetical protein
MASIKQNKIDLRPYYTAGLPVLGLMAVIGLMGIAATVALHFIFQLF